MFNSTRMAIPESRQGEDMLRRQTAVAIAITATALATAATAIVMTGGSAAAPASVAAGVPRHDHVVIAIFENKNQSSIIGSSNAPYINSLATQGASFSNSFGLTHPSQPNYIGLFSGSLQGVSDDSCPKNFTGKANLGSQLIGAGLGFAGYSEGQPSDGYTGCSSGRYARKHNPWVDFDNVPAASNLRFSRFPTDFTQLPTVSFVVPDLCNDMHDCSVATGDTWLRNNLDAYAQWAKTHNSLLIVTFDEDNFTSVNRIATVFYGQQVRAGVYTEQINHYNVLRTLEDAYGLTPINNAATATPITDIWTTSTPSPTSSPTSSPPAGCTGTNGNDVTIPDLSTVESPITISGCSGNASATSTAEVHIVHTYRGDLIVSLVAPDGSVYTLLNRSGGSADNVDQTFTVNLSSEARNGTWKLRVQDAAAQDTGFINTWTLKL
jgi:hypothetical protein